MTKAEFDRWNELKVKGAKNALEANLSLFRSAICLWCLGIQSFAKMVLTKLH
jgi:hypothetical protein